ncbi:DUF2780 domain-containing protein [Ferrimonas sp. YFM]|uniref:DUF2780 domain-containing protein n=1 Tax=Ferrimonas sp. YFM TaxID=3028878 RepID=UPI0025734210|nr:DUF2780 domain-containing protein [Ferrimonas sp. YFM]BDY05811.1 hypothetical protein F0521_28520 [Ferrimonas sp. YFM]
MLKLFAPLFLSLVCFSTPAQAVDDLLGLVTSQLGVSQEQASGGIGALLATAEPNLSSDTLGQLSQVLPGMEGLTKLGGDLLAKAGEGNGTSGLLGTVLGQSGGALMGLNDAFASLGLSPDMVASFSQILLDYVNQQGGEGLMQQLQSALL